jgi:hypothetical protein
VSQPENGDVLTFLLDEQISQDVAEGFRRRHHKRTDLSLVEWQNGRFLGPTDDLILKEAAAENLTLVTYDRKTIPPLLKTWAEAGQGHGGVIFVDEKTIPASDFWGALIRAPRTLFQKSAKWDWTNRVCFLRRQAFVFKETRCVRFSCLMNSRRRFTVAFRTASFPCSLARNRPPLAFPRQVRPPVDELP